MYHGSMPKNFPDARRERALNLLCAVLGPVGTVLLVIGSGQQLATAAVGKPFAQPLALVSIVVGITALLGCASFTTTRSQVGLTLGGSIACLGALASPLFPLDFPGVDILLPTWWAAFLPSLAGVLFGSALACEITRRRASSRPDEDLLRIVASDQTFRAPLPFSRGRDSVRSFYLSAIASAGLWGLLLIRAHGVDVTGGPTHMFLYLNWACELITLMGVVVFSLLLTFSGMFSSFGPLFCGTFFITLPACGVSFLQVITGYGIGPNFPTATAFGLTAVPLSAIGAAAVATVHAAHWARVRSCSKEASKRDLDLETYLRDMEI